MPNKNAFVALLLPLLLLAAPATAADEPPQIDDYQVPLPNLQGYDESLASLEDLVLQDIQHGEGMKAGIAEMAANWPSFREKLNRAHMGSQWIGTRLHSWAETERDWMTIPRLAGSFAGAGGIGGALQGAAKQSGGLSTGAAIGIGGGGLGIVGLATSLSYASWKKKQLEKQKLEQQQRQQIFNSLAAAKNGTTGDTVRLTRDDLAAFRDPENSGVFNLPSGLTAAARIAAGMVAG